MSIDKYNQEGYKDPTTYEALTNVIKEERAAAIKAVRRPLVYVCSPYAGDIENNIANACEYGRFTYKQDAIPLVPHLMYPQFMDDAKEDEREMAMHFNYVLLGKCSELWVFGGVISKGMAREIGIASKRRMKIKWFNAKLEEVDAYA